MFVSYNLQEFGSRVRKLRKSLGMTQQAIQDMVGINVDSIRRIENGEVIPRYDTLELLTVVYKSDLLDLLKECRSNKLLIDLHDDLDSLFISYNEQKMKKLLVDIENLPKTNGEYLLVRPQEIQQLQRLVTGNILYRSNMRNEMMQAYHILLEAMRLTIPSFNIYQYKTYRYNYIESRILILLSILLAEREEVPLSTEIMEYILKRMRSSEITTQFKNVLIINLYTNIAYNLHSMDEHEKIIPIVNEGIQFALKKETTFGLHLLYYRKGVAEYYCKVPTFRKNIENAFMVLRITNQLDLLKTYKEITVRNYGIVTDI